MNLRENRALMGILFPIVFELGLIEAYLFFVQKNKQSVHILELSTLLPLFLLIFPAYLYYIYSPYLIVKVSRVSKKYLKNMEDHLDEIFVLDSISLPTKTKHELKRSIKRDLLPKLVKVFRRQYIDTYFTRDGNSPINRMLSFKESLFLLSISFGILNFFNLITILYLHFNSIDFDFIYIDRIVNPLNIVVFSVIFSMFCLLSVLLFIHTRKNLIVLISQFSYNIIPYENDIKTQTRQMELNSIRKFPLNDKIGSKLAANWDLVSKLYLGFIESHVKEELQEFTKKDVARSLALKQYSVMLDKLDISSEERRELEIQFYLGQGITEAIEDLVHSEEETESIKMDMLQVSKKLEEWDNISKDEQISTFLFLWRTTESLFRYSLWKRRAYPQDDQSWLSIVNALLKEKLITEKENVTLKKVRIHRNAIIHRTQKSKERFVPKEDIEDLLEILQSVLDRI